MESLDVIVGEIISLEKDQILQGFGSGKFPDKTFSKLFAKWLGIPVRPGLILEIIDKKLHHCYCITDETKDFLFLHDEYVFLYDFRADFRGIEEWMNQKRIRPGPSRCRKENILEQLETVIEKGSNFIDRFFIIIVPYLPGSPFAASTVNGEFTYIEYSDHPDAIHGSEDVKLCIVHGGTLLHNETNLAHDTLLKIVQITENFTSHIGPNTTCEFLFSEGFPCLISAQKRGNRRITRFSPAMDDMLFICDGPIEGEIKRVKKSSVPETIRNLSNRDQEYVFLAERPYSDLADLVKFARAFIFEEGSMLCHLAILLREKEIPARIIHGISARYRDGDSIFLP
ncbi:MAG: hypothetical protein HXS44_10830 [Theionarchaea archaeon]|nr:hypothetical protein [Theionarchaea archaeon]